MSMKEQILNMREKLLEAHVASSSNSSSSSSKKRSPSPAKEASVSSPWRKRKAKLEAAKKW
eukprot:6350455-Karenia_brevis.AAC.1